MLCIRGHASPTKSSTCWLSISVRHCSVKSSILLKTTFVLKAAGSLNPRR